MKIYTKGGDLGQTSLASGERVSKDNPKVDIYGAVDELNSLIGVGISLLPSDCSSLITELQTIQNTLFELASELAGFYVNKNKNIITTNDIEELEQAIDSMQQTLKPLTSFILPGGHPAAANIHVARTACRKLERQMVSSMNQTDYSSFVTAQALAYINRLSDYLFVAARFTNEVNGISDILWKTKNKT